jgi:hypothetical protein
MRLERRHWETPVSSAFVRYTYTEYTPKIGSVKIAWIWPRWNIGMRV